jgi:deoxyribonucleoside regulator
MKFISDQGKSSNLIEAARLCYEFGISQKEAAKTLGVSTATLSRFLKSAREQGVVKVTICTPESDKTYAKLSQSLKRILGIGTVIVIPTSENRDFLRKSLGYEAANWVISCLSTGMSLGFSGGRSVSEVIAFLKKGEVGTEIVQLMGGISSLGKKIQADVIARDAASILKAACHVIHGPAIFADKDSLDSFLMNGIVSNVVKRFDSLEIAVVGLGYIDTDYPLMQGGFLTEKELKHLRAEDCVGEICGHFFNPEGKECSTTLAQRTLGIQLNQLAKIRQVCLIAAGDEKVRGIIAASKAHIPKVLITDSRTAEGIQHHEK